MERESHRETEPKQKGLELTESEKTYLATKFMQILDEVGDEVVPWYIDKYIANTKEDFIAKDEIIQHLNVAAGPIRTYVFEGLCEMFGINDAAIKKAMGGPGSIPKPDRLKSLIVEAKDEEEEGSAAKSNVRDNTHASSEPVRPGSLRAMFDKPGRKKVDY